MRPNEQNFERLLKKLIKQQPVTSADLLFHWRGLGTRGDRILISMLNKMNGWESFLLWSESEPIAREQIVELSLLSGISEAGVLALKGAGMITGDGESPRAQSLWILQTVRSGPSEDWERAADLLFQNQDFFDGTLSLLELEESAHAAHFLSTLLEGRPSREQDQAIRKTLYRFRQKGIDAPRKETQAITVEPDSPTEIFLFAENRMPLWQPFFYYRARGARGDWFFSEINEGKTFEIIQQQRDIRINQKGMQGIADRYSGEFQKGTGVSMKFVPFSPVHAHHFLKKSFQLLQGSEDFRKYLGERPSEDPAVDWNARTGLAQADAALLLQLEYFQLWLAEPELLDTLSERIKQIEEGPILLLEQQTRQQKTEAIENCIKEYLTVQKRKVWALALEKATYFLMHTDPDMAAISLGLSRKLVEPQSGGDGRDPFIDALVERSLAIREKQKATEEQEAKRSSLIMTPQEFERTLNTETQRHRDKK